VLSNPLAAGAGPDLNLVGTGAGTNYHITAGTTDDFGLPNPGGRPTTAQLRRTTPRLARNPCSQPRCLAA
jgi:hypothetical protein